jgi:hypothetical protein
MREGSSGGIALRPDGEVYVAGFTSASDFPTSTNAFQRSLRSSTDCFVTRLSADGSRIVASTFLGGTGSAFEECEALNLDSSGNPIVMGITGSTDFPTTAGALQRTLRGPTDAFFTKLSPDLSTVLVSTLIGGSGSEVGDSSSRGEFDSSGNIFFAVSTDSRDFPLTADAEQQTYGGGSTDTAAVALSPDASRLVYATYLGGSGTDFNRSMRFSPR